MIRSTNSNARPTTARLWAAVTVTTGALLFTGCGDHSLRDQARTQPDEHTGPSTDSNSDSMLSDAEYDAARIENGGRAKTIDQAERLVRETTKRTRPDSIDGLTQNTMPAETSVLTQGVAAPAGELTEAYVSNSAYTSDYDTVVPIYPVDENRETYAAIETNPTKRVLEQPVSTFSIDVDTAAYANVRRFLNDGQLPPENAVRVEELINYFDYSYDTPTSEQTPFSINTQLMPTPWNANTKLLHIGLRGYDVEPKTLPASNLVFLVDVSGSMASPDKLPLLQRALKLVSNQMRSDDRVAIVVYAGASGVVLDSTPGDEKRAINRALDDLLSGGGTNGASGIRLAYEIAAENFIDDGINRVILATDGDFNVGTVNFDELIDLVESRRRSGISLTTLGFGTGNYNDHLMEQLADSGNGNYAYIDTINEANKVLVEQMSSTLQTIASDVKIQIEFNPKVVSEYRLIGYENRHLRREDFSNDKVDAGDLGAGHTVTAIYEVALVGDGGERIESLRYGDDENTNIDATTPRDNAARSGEVAHVRLRYKRPGETVSERLEHSVLQRDALSSVGAATEDVRFATAVAAFGQLLRGGPYVGDFDFDDAAELARTSRGDDHFGYRSEFLRLVSMAKSLQPLALSSVKQANQ